MAPPTPAVHWAAYAQGPSENGLRSTQSQHQIRAVVRSVRTRLIRAVTGIKTIDYGVKNDYGPPIRSTTRCDKLRAVVRPVGSAVPFTGRSLSTKRVPGLMACLKGQSEVSTWLEVRWNFVWRITTRQLVGHQAEKATSSV